MTALEQFTRDLAWYKIQGMSLIDGTYGNDLFEDAKADYNRTMQLTPRRKAQNLRRIVINAFTSLVARELDCSYGHAQKTITQAIPADELKALTQEYISQLPIIFAE